MINDELIIKRQIIIANIRENKSVKYVEPKETSPDVISHSCFNIFAYTLSFDKALQ